MLYLGRYLLYFIVLNLILNFVYQISPFLGLLLFVGFIFYSFRNSVRFTSFRSSPIPPPPSTSSSFRKDPNVIDAEFKEHKTH